MVRVGGGCDAGDSKEIKMVEREVQVKRRESQEVNRQKRLKTEQLAANLSKLTGATYFDMYTSSIHVG
jgi:hypothetical protein